MVTTILSNQVGGRELFVHLTSNDTLVVAGNSTVSNLTSNSTEVVVLAKIAQVYYGCDGGGNWQIKRVCNSSANTIIAVYPGAGHDSFNKEGGFMLDLYNTGNISANLSGSVNGHLIIHIKKESHF